MSTNNENGCSFKFSISGDDVYGTAPMLLGRDNPYTLNVKLVDKDGKPVSGVEYTMSSTNDGKHRVNLDGMDKTYTSSGDGNDFFLEGLVATQDAHVGLMQYEFSVDCVTGEGADKVTGKQVLRMGRLLKWGRPGISVKTGPDKAVFTTKTERVGRESIPGAKWNWGQKIDTCNITIGDSIAGAGATSLTGNNDASFQAAPEIDLSKFSSVSKAKIQFEGGLSSDGFTAVLASSQDNVELYYFQSVAFIKPSVIVGVPAEVTCTLMGLDNKPRANVDVEWSTTFGTLNPVGSKTDAQGLAKTACTANDPGTATVTVLSNAQRMIKGTSAAVPVGPLVIVDPTASDAQFVVGHSGAIKFSVVLQAGGQPVSGLKVDWLVGDSVKATSTSDSSGKATQDLTFTVGQAVKQVVKARVLDTQVQTTFDVNVYTAEITDPKATATEYVVGHSADVEFSVVLKAGGKPLSGKTIEWAVGGNKSNSTTDSTGKATFKKAFDAAGAITVSAKDPNSGKTHNFQLNVVAVEITDPKASATEYVIKHSADVEFSVVLKAGGMPLSGKTIEWTVGGNRSNSTTDSTGKATFKKAFDAAGAITVSAKDPNSGKTHNFQLKVVAVEITDPTASATEYVVGYSPDVEFSVVVVAGENAMQGLTVTWLIYSSVIGTTQTDRAGKATVRTGFSLLGNNVVTALVDGKKAEITISAIKYEFAVSWSSSHSDARQKLSTYPDCRFRGLPYEVLVKIVNKGAAVEGVPFTVNTDGEAQNYVSSKNGTKLSLKFPNADGQYHGEWVYSSPAAIEKKERYRLGWLYSPSSAKAEGAKVEIKWNVVVEGSGQYGYFYSVVIGPVEVEVENKWKGETPSIANTSGELHVRVDTGSKVVSGNTLHVGEAMLASGYVLLNTKDLRVS
mgnify:CR=1 FL=1